MEDLIIFQFILKYNFFAIFDAYLWNATTTKFVSFHVQLRRLWLQQPSNVEIAFISLKNL